MDHAHRDSGGHGSGRCAGAEVRDVVQNTRVPGLRRGERSCPSSSKRACLGDGNWPCHWREERLRVWKEGVRPRLRVEREKETRFRVSKRENDVEHNSVPKVRMHC